MAAHTALMSELRGRLIDLAVDRDRWHAEAIQWRARAMGPVPSVPSRGTGASAPPLPRASITPDLDAAIEEQLLLAGDPGIRNYMMAEVARRLARGDDEAAVLHAIRSGESGAVA